MTIKENSRRGQQPEHPKSDKPWVTIIIAIISAGGLIVVAILANWDKIRRPPQGPDPAPTIEQKTEVQSGKVDGIGPVSPDLCTSGKPCSGLKRGSTLTIKLNRPGYAVAFLQDASGMYFNQEGKTIVANVDQDSRKLWPEPDTRVAHPVFKLWVVTSASTITTYPDSQALQALPVSTNEQRWGPIYLEMAPAH